MQNIKRVFSIAFACIFVILCGMYFYPYVNQSIPKHLDPEHKNGIGFVFYNKHTSYIAEKQFQGCENKCHESLMDYTLAKYVIFLGPKLTWFPPKKVNGQVWILYGHEAPHNSGWLYFWNNVFNWTINYRRDSDIHYGYGRFSTHKGQEQVIYYNKSDWKFSTNPIKSAWVVSNCKTLSKRDQFVDLLNMDGKHYTDVFGNCGSLECLNCFSLISKKYPLYLSFENSLCRDYITEKAFNMMQLNIIPVVRGEKYTYQNWLPPNSYVSVHDFTSVYLLNQYLINLVSNKTQYTKMFTWRKHYQSLPEKDIFCELCDYAHQNEVKRQTKLYENIELWNKGDTSRPVCIYP